MAVRRARAAIRLIAANWRADGLYRESPGRTELRRGIPEELQKLGWVEGRNTQIHTRWTAGHDVGARQRSAKELVAQHPDLILAHNTPVTAALLRETRTIPIVFATVADPVGTGFVDSLSRLSGNITGFSNIEASTR